jgi:undecaprenyl-diphosphatase
MELIQTFLMGIVQGLSEFLPISSSGHLVFTSALYNYLTGNASEIETGEEIFLSMMLHVGTLIAILVFFKKEIFDITKALFNAIKLRSLKDDNAKLGLYIILGTFFTILVAYPLNDISEFLMYAPNVVGILLVITGVYLLLSENLKKDEKTNKITLKRAVIIGIVQGIAAFPGFSRSGFTIATGLFTGLDRTTSARFSFLLSFPIILGASIIYPLLELDMEDIINYNWMGIAIGIVSSAIVGYYCIKYFLKFISKFSLKFFAYYCIIVGAISAIFFTVIKFI